MQTRSTFLPSVLLVDHQTEPNVVAAFLGTNNATFFTYIYEQI